MNDVDLMREFPEHKFGYTLKNIAILICLMNLKISQSRVDLWQPTSNDPVGGFLSSGTSGSIWYLDYSGVTLERNPIVRFSDVIDNHGSRNISWNAEIKDLFIREITLLNVMLVRTALSILTLSKS